MIFPVLVSCARTCPSIDGSKTTPGIAVGGDFCETEQPRWPAHGWHGRRFVPDDLSRWPDRTRTTRSLRWPPVRRAALHLRPRTPARLRQRCPTARRRPGPPTPKRVDHTILPFWSGSSPCSSADFCPCTSICLPPPISTRTGEPPRSTSVPAFSGQLPLSPLRAAQPQLNMSGAVCRLHLILPVSMSMAITASAVLMSGPE